MTNSYYIANILINMNFNLIEKKKIRDLLQTL